MHKEVFFFFGLPVASMSCSLTSLWALEISYWGTLQRYSSLLLREGALHNCIMYYVASCAN